MRIPLWDLVQMHSKQEMTNGENQALRSVSVADEQLDSSAPIALKPIIF
jgi:hypothetical protein